MSNSYDVALVLGSTTLDKGVKGLYDNPNAKGKLFSGNVSNPQMQSVGIESVDWSIDASPTFTLTPPTQEQWDNKNTFFPSDNHPSKPSSDMFQVVLSSFSTTLNMKQGEPIKLSFDATVFAQVTVANNKITLGSVGVLPGNVPPAGQLYLEILSSIVYTQVTKLLAGYTIPSTITVEGIDFTAPVATVTGSHLVVASNLTATGTPDISGVTWPDQEFAVLVSRNFMNALIDKYKSKIVQEMDSKNMSHSGSNWAGGYSVSGGITGSSINLDSTLPNIDVTATISATASLSVSWWLVPGACAMEAASNLI